MLNRGEGAFSSSRGERKLVQYFVVIVLVRFDYGFSRQFLCGEIIAI